MRTISEHTKIARRRWTAHGPTVDGSGLAVVVNLRIGFGRGRQSTDVDSWNCVEKVAEHRLTAEEVTTPAACSRRAAHSCLQPEGRCVTQRAFPQAIPPLSPKGAGGCHINNRPALLEDRNLILI